MTLYEVNQAAEIIQEAAGEDAKYIFGLVEDPKMSDEIMVTVIATGFSKKEEVKVAEHRVIVGEPFYSGLRTKGKISVMPSGEELKRLDGPAYERREVNLNEDLSENISKPKIYEEENDFIDINPDEDFSKPSFLRRQMD